MSCSKFSIFITLICLLHESVLSIKQPYIVYLGQHLHEDGLTTAELDQRVVDSHHQFLASFLGSKVNASDAIIYSYKGHINGFTAFLEDNDAADIAKHPDVVSVFVDKGAKLHTTYSWKFVNLEKRAGGVHHTSLWKQANFGEDVIIANLDSGVWPESKSFRDHGYGPIPAKWKGDCHHSGLPNCNKKLIGARYFNKVFNAIKGVTNINSARDTEGHGSHTLSTAAGNFVAKVSSNGLEFGTAKGGSPRARVAAYKVCWPPVDDGEECATGDIMQGFESAIHDRVDVISVSLGGGLENYFEDGTAIGSFHAVKNGIVVVTSAGNDGPDEGSVTNVAPWLITVGASTIDRRFSTEVLLGNGSRLQGETLGTKPLPDQILYPLVSAVDAKADNASVDDAKLCVGESLNPDLVKGKILVCLRGLVSRIGKGITAIESGAVGMILCNDEANGNNIDADPHVLPASHISYRDGLALYAYINSTEDPVGYITPNNLGYGMKHAPVMATFSSKGPNRLTPEILKPDITAPGVNIIAAYSEAEGASGSNTSTPFALLSGTSMSCPHVSGVVGLLKKLHPNWSPAAIKSAIMTTARTRDNIRIPMLDSSFEKATPFSYGAGHIRPNRAMDPGLVYDLSPNDYLDFLCGVGYNSTLVQKLSGGSYKCPEHFSLLNFNYPSISVPYSYLNSTVTVSRTLKNVGTPGTYTARIRQPVGVSVSVEPSTLTFGKPDEEKSFKLSLELEDTSKVKNVTVFGELLWSDGKHHVRSPIVVAAATPISLEH